MNNWRIHFVFFFIIIAGLGITARMFYIQIINSGYYSALARGQSQDYSEVQAQRGDIFLRDEFSGGSSSFLAATNKDYFSLYAVPKEIKDVELVSARFGISQEKLNNTDDPYEPLVNMLSEEDANKALELGIEGIYAKKEKIRYYPAKDLLSHVLGFVGYSGDQRVGQYGVEGFYNEALAGGKDLNLTIDYNIQFTLEEKLREKKDYLDADGASAIVMDPKTGEIIALAVIDSFDLNNYSGVKNIDIFLNDAVQKMFEPGSVFKPFTAAAAIDKGLISPSTKYIDKGAIKIGKYTIRNSDEKSHGEQSMTNVLELSLNTGAIFMEQTLGHDQFREYVKRFGFGERSGVDLQGEVFGDVRNITDTSRDINFATASFGQGIAVTPIQLVVAFSAFANAGKMVNPHVNKDLETEIIGEPISPKTAALVTNMLVSAVENGYGKKAKVLGYKVAGKSGTAQVPNEEKGGYLEDKTVHSFIGFAPAYDPRFIALVKLDNPKGINFSSDSIAPLFSEIAEYILNYYEIPPGD